MYVSQETPVWLDYRVQTRLLSDETEIVQLGESVDRYYNSFIESKLKPEYSSWNAPITQDSPQNRYKFASLEVNMSKDLRQINRETYSLLDWLGDVGGLLECLQIIGELLISSVSIFVFKARLMSLIVAFRRS